MYIIMTQTKLIQLGTINPVFLIKRVILLCKSDQMSADDYSNG